MPASEDAGWQRLSGTMSVVERRGDVVRRRMDEWSPSVHRLLDRLEGAGFAAAPRLLGVVGQWDLLSFVHGDVPSQGRLRSGWRASDDAVAAAARLLRGIHDATVGLADEGLAWSPRFLQSELGPVICHNDFGPWNCTFVDGMPAGMIDFSAAAPGSREWDLAFSAMFFIPLYAHADLSGAPRRLRLMCDAYGLDDRSHVLAALVARSQRTVDVARAWIEVGGVEAALGRDILPFATSSLHALQDALPGLERALR